MTGAASAAGRAASVGAGVDWKKVLSKCSPSVRKGIVDIRARHEDLRRLIGEGREGEARLDFAHYRKRLLGTAHEKMVEESEAAVQAYQPARLDVSEQLRSWAEQRERKMREAGHFLEAMEAQIAEMKARLAKIRNAKPVDEMTVDDVYEIYPEYRERIHRDLKSDNWATEPDADGDGGEGAAKGHHH